jgi:hypothetical protein
MLVALLTLALQQRPPLTPSDTVAIQKVAREHLKCDAPRASIVLVRGDTVSVHVGNRVSYTRVRVVRKKEQWVALKDTVEVRGIY